MQFDFKTCLLVGTLAAAAASDVHAALITTLADAGDSLVDSSKTSTNDNSASLGIKTFPTKISRQGYIEFNVGTTDLSVFSTATLNLKVTTYNDNNVATTTPFVVDVYGVGTNTTANFFDETAITYSSAPGSVTPTTTNLGGVNSATTTLLGSFTAVTPTSTINSGTGTFSSTSLLTFLKNDTGTDGYATLMLVRHNTDSTLNTGFASKQASSGAPSITLEVPEPTSMALFGGSLILSLRRRRIV